MNRRHGLHQSGKELKKHRARIPILIYRRISYTTGKDRFQKYLMAKKNRDISVAFFGSHIIAPRDFSYSMGIAYISAFLKEKGITSAYSSGGSRELVNFLELIKDRGVKVLGIPVYDILFPHAAVIAREARRMIPDLLIVAGGPAATFGDDIILNNIPEIDIAVRGEGEETMFDLYRFLHREISPEKIKGISFRGASQIIRTPNRPLVGAEGTKGSELDILPSPFEKGILTGYEYLGGLQASRGCVFKCAFCSSPAFCNGKIRFHSIERIINDLKIISGNILNEGREKKLFFWDENFSLYKERTVKLCEALIKENFKFKFFVESRIDNMDRDLLSLMYRAGFRNITFGLESASPGILRTTKKVNGKSEDLTEEKKYLESARRTLRLCNELGIETVVNVMFGLPGETYEDGMKTVKFVEELDLNVVSSSCFMLFVGTDFYNNKEKYGLEIIQGETPLPVKHRPPYDINRISIIPYDSRIKLDHFSVQSFENAVFQWYDKNHLFFNDPGPDIILEDIHHPDNAMLEWMKKISGFFSQVIAVYNETRPSRKNITGMGRVLRQNLLQSPINNAVQVLCRSFEKRNDGAKHYRLRTGTLSKPSINWPSDYISYPFANISNSKNPKSAGCVKFYGIETRQDVETFIERMVNPGDESGDSAAGKLICSGMLIDSSCRFMKNSCPAVKLKKIHVGRSGELRVCKHGVVIGVVGDRVETLKERVEMLVKDVESDRGCLDCRARNYCPGCLFPEPFTVREYCEFMKSSAWMPRTVQFISMCRTNMLGDMLFPSKNIKTPFKRDLRHS